MKAIRAAMTVFLLLVLTIACFGWSWSADLPSENLLGARMALGIAAVSSVVGLAVIWSVKPRPSA